MSTRTSDLFMLEDLEDGGRTPDLAEGDRNALRAVAGWIRSFVMCPHAELGRPGSVCPFVPGSVERRALWLAPARVADRELPDLVELMDGYKRRLLDLGRAEADHVDDQVIVVVFTDLAAARAQEVFDQVLQEIAAPSYVEDGIVFGPFYDGNQGTAIYNTSFHPFRSPVPFVFVRHGVVSDWKFFVDADDWLSRWAHRFGEPAVHALAAELRRLPWRAPHT